MPLFISADALITNITHSQANGKQLSTLTAYVHTLTQIDIEMEITVFHSSDLVKHIADLQVNDRIFFTGPATYESTGWFVIANYFLVITGDERIDALVFGTAFYEKTIRSTEEIINFNVQTTNWHKQSNFSQRYECAAEKLRFQNQIEKMRPTSGVIIQGLLSPHGGNPMNLYIVSLTYNSGTRMETNSPPQIQKEVTNQSARIASLFSSPPSKELQSKKTLTIAKNLGNKRKNAYGSDIAESDNSLGNNDQDSVSENENELSASEENHDNQPKKKTSPKSKVSPKQKSPSKSPRQSRISRKSSKR